MPSASAKYKIGFRVWITGTEGHFLGAGRVRLLENIREMGTITGAAKEMKMSYRQAWQMVEDMNQRSYEPLVLKTLGGKGGGGAHITGAGEKAIQTFYEVEKSVSDFTLELNKKLNL